MLQSRKIIMALMGFLFLNILLVNCECSKQSDRDKKDGSNQSNEELKKLTEEEKKLVEEFSKTHSLTTEQVQKYEEHLQALKEQGAAAILLELGTFTLNRNLLESPATADMGSINSIFGSLIPGFKLRDHNSAKKALDSHISILNNIGKQVELKNKGKK